VLARFDETRPSDAGIKPINESGVAFRSQNPTSSFGGVPE
jgi:hypothetical protein